MRFHIISLPHTQTTEAFSACAFTEKVRKFARMMKARGHTVILYSGEQNEAPCDEHIACITEEARVHALAGRHYVEGSFDPNLPHWQTFNRNVITAMGPRLQPQDFICLIGGHAQKAIADAFPAHLSVEFGIGYSGTFAKFRVFESYAWMHSVYAQQRNASLVDGQWFDAVIPNYLEIEKFPFRAEKEDYYLYLGRLVDRKGWRTAVATTERLGAKLVLAGPGDAPAGLDYRGVVAPAERGRLLSGAKALFVPTQYIEPFGTVAIEAMACGTPAITTDWGAFPETVVQGVTGFRCRTLGEFEEAARKVGELDPEVIRDHVQKHYSLEVVGEMYERYFQRLGLLWDKGWYN